MKTAVEWLQEKWLKYDLNVGKSGFNLLLKQALEGEKKQIIKFAETYEEYCHNSFTQNRYVQVKSAEQYYNETFKSE